MKNLTLVRHATKKVSFLSGDRKFIDLEHGDRILFLGSDIAKQGQQTFGLWCHEDWSYDGPDAKSSIVDLELATTCKDAWKEMT